MNIEGNILVFDTDDEITTFCLDPTPIAFPREINGQIIYCYNYDWTPDYKDVLAKGMLMKVKQPNSSVMKHKAVHHGVITKKLTNLSR